MIRSDVPDMARVHRSISTSMPVLYLEPAFLATSLLKTAAIRSNGYGNSLRGFRLNVERNSMPRVFFKATYSLGRLPGGSGCSSELLTNNAPPSGRGNDFL